MADEIEDNGVAATPAAAPAAPEPREYTEVEQRAMAQGWVPEDQYTGTKKWRPADDFLDRGELFAKIDEQGRRLKSYDQTIMGLKSHLEKVRKTEYARALAEIRAEKKAALLDGDADAVLNADDRMEQLRNEQRLEEQREAIVAKANANAGPPPEVQAWMARNPWYNTDKAMKVYADQIGHEQVLAGNNDPAKVLAEVERLTKLEFAHKFKNPNREKAGAVEGAGGKGNSQPKDTIQLTDEETRVMNRFVKAGVLTKEEYLADIKASRGV